MCERHSTALLWHGNDGSRSSRAFHWPWSVGIEIGWAVDIAPVEMQPINQEIGIWDTFRSTGVGLLNVYCRVGNSYGLNELWHPFIVIRDMCNYCDCPNWHFFKWQSLSLHIKTSPIYPPRPSFRMQQEVCWFPLTVSYSRRLPQVMAKVLLIEFPGSSRKKNREINMFPVLDAIMSIP